MDTYHLTPRQEGIANELPGADGHRALVRHGCTLWGGVVNVPGVGGREWVGEMNDEKKNEKRGRRGGRGGGGLLLAVRLCPSQVIE